MAATTQIGPVLDDVRIRICPKCPRFGIACTGAGSADDRCADGKCDLVTELPRLAQISRQRDPLVGASLRSFERAIDEVLANPSASRPKVLRRFRPEVAAMLVRFNSKEEHRPSRRGNTDRRISDL